MHNSLMGTKNQEVKLQEITAKATWRIQGGEDLHKPTKEDSSKIIPYFKYCSCDHSYTAFKPINRKKFPTNALVTVNNTCKLAVINES